MKNKLVFRILGALSSALIIVSVFVPFVKVTGYSQSLWQTNLNTLYLPIIIIVFGAIGVLLFATNLKTELAYSTTGALVFFLITQTIPIIKQGTFSTLNVGYYFLVVGTLFTGIMTFLCGIKTKQKITEETKVEEIKEDSMIHQIDKLYENQAIQNNDGEINQVEMLQPLQSIQPSESLNQSNNSLNIPIEENQTENLNDLLQPSIQANIQEENKPAVEPNFEQPTIIAENHEVQTPVSNPVVSEFEISQMNVTESEPMSTVQQTSNPVVSEFEVPKYEESFQTVNPVVSELANYGVDEMNNIQMPSNSLNSVTSEFEIPSVQISNPVVSEFEMHSQFNVGVVPTVEQTIENNQEQSPTIEHIEPLQPLNSNIDKVDVMADPTIMKENSSSNLDIFD